MPVIPSDLLVSLGLRRTGDEQHLPEHARRLGDALIQSDSVIVTVRKGNSSPPPTHLLAHDAVFPLGQSVTNMSVCADV